MNIFILDKSISESVESYIDKHVVKMILESGQLLCMANSVLKVVGHVPVKLENSQQDEVVEFSKQFKGKDITERSIPYLPIKTQLNHPCSIWTRTSLSNWQYLKSMMEKINKEYKYRYDNDENHKTYKTLKDFKPPSNLKDKGLTTPPLAMPDEYKKKSVISAYRSYYINEKRNIASWTKRERPDWFEFDR